MRHVLPCLALFALALALPPHGWAGRVSPADVVVADPAGACADGLAPVTASLPTGAPTGRRLRLRERIGGRPAGPAIAAQVDGGPGADAPRIRFLLPPGAAGTRSFAVLADASGGPAAMTARVDPATGQAEIAEEGRPVLRYLFRTVEPGKRLAPIAPTNLIYARARSDYIHPLYGLDGQELTLDWPRDHPHHRGIYWAWPEVGFAGELGDLHALQRVFARPAGAMRLASGPVFARVEAENTWMWDDRVPIVRERAVLRAYRETPVGRLIDLELHFRALRDGVTLARRGTEHYGGLNVRMGPVADQRILFHTDPEGARPRTAWASLCGVFPGSPNSADLVILQHPANPDFPGDWVQYPELNWFQPTFPRSGTRHALERPRPLTLRYRLWVRRGGPAPEARYARQWRAYADGAPAEP
ncbi:MAG: PmoA family protein [Chthonomonadales bacterium]|nr:PmoA family protein [Chthonomonadales bacterium]